MNARAVAFGILIILLAVSACDDDTRSRTTEGAASELHDDQDIGGCDTLPSADDLKRFMNEGLKLGVIGGLAGAKNEWAAVVNRNGRVCAVAASNDTVTTIWPGSQAIALAKAYTANAFSLDPSPMSTARLYTMSLPGHTLWGASAGNPLHPDCLVTPGDAGKQEGKLCGGTIVFGGGLPLYREGKVVGGLGLSGDTPCADHELAKQVRRLANLVPPGGNMVDDIIYPSVDSASVYAHPVCMNTYRNGIRIGDEEPVAEF